MSHTHPHEHKLLYRSFNLSFSLFLIRALIISLRYVQSHQRHFLLPFSSTSKIISLFLCLICFLFLSFFIAVPFIFAFLQHPLFSLWMFTFALPFPTRFHASDPRSLSLSLSGWKWVSSESWFVRSFVLKHFVDIEFSQRLSFFHENETHSSCED